MKSAGQSRWALSSISSSNSAHITFWWFFLSVPRPSHFFSFHQSASSVNSLVSQSAKTTLVTCALESVHPTLLCPHIKLSLTVKSVFFLSLSQEQYSWPWKWRISWSCDVGHCARQAVRMRAVLLSSDDPVCYAEYPGLELFVDSSRSLGNFSVGCSSLVPVLQWRSIADSSKHRSA